VLNDRPVRSVAALGLLVAILVSCIGPASPSRPPAVSPSGSPSGAPSGTPPASPLTVGLGFIPSVQFAPYYLAEQDGLYRDAGLEVTFQHEADPNLVTLVGQGAVDVGNADGTSVIPAVSQGIPIRYVFTVYARFPSVVFAKAETGITTPADLDGRRLGIPFRAGSSWIMLQALLDSAGLDPQDLEIVEFPDFGQRVAVEEGVVEAATGFVNNEPVRMRLAGEQVTVLSVDDITPLPGPGLIVGERTLAEKRDALHGFVAATREAMELIIADPQRGLEAAIVRVPELADEREAQLAVLEATIATWTSDYTREHGLGAIDRDAWEVSVEFMGTLPGGLVPNPVAVDDLVSEELLDE
jgi:NitT/TauT family transport system substrate-binding protein